MELFLIEANKLFSRPGYLPYWGDSQKDWKDVDTLLFKLQDA
jgi:hypothetical protein